MTTFLKRFCLQEDGAVTVDWVVLSAAVVGISVLAIGELRSNSNDLSVLTSDYLLNQDPAAAAGGNIHDGGVNAQNNQSGS